MWKHRLAPSLAPQGCRCDPACILGFKRCRRYELGPHPWPHGSRGYSKTLNDRTPHTGPARPAQASPYPSLLSARPELTLRVLVVLW